MPESANTFKLNSLWGGASDIVRAVLNAVMVAIVGLGTYFLAEIRSNSEKAFDKIEALSVSQAEMKGDVRRATDDVKEIREYMSTDIDSLKQRVTRIEGKLEDKTK